MRYLTFIRSPESLRNATPPQALMEAMGGFIQKSFADGSLVDTGGLAPSRDGFKLRISKGQVLVVDGPFTETKEVIGGWAIIQASTREEVLRVTREFMQLHIDHWPEFEGESEVRLIET